MNIVKAASTSLPRSSLPILPQAPPLARGTAPRLLFQSHLSPPPPPPLAASHTFLPYCHTLLKSLGVPDQVKDQRNCSGLTRKVQHPHPRIRDDDDHRPRIGSLAPPPPYHSTRSERNCNRPCLSHSPHPTDDRSISDTITHTAPPAPAPSLSQTSFFNLHLSLIRPLHRYRLRRVNIAKTGISEGQCQAQI